MPEGNTRKRTQEHNLGREHREEHHGGRERIRQGGSGLSGRGSEGELYRDHNSIGSTRILKDDRLGGQEEARRRYRRHQEKSAEKNLSSMLATIMQNSGDRQRTHDN